MLYRYNVICACLSPLPRPPNSDYSACVHIVVEMSRERVYRSPFCRCRLVREFLFKMYGTRGAAQSSRDHDDSTVVRPWQLPLRRSIKKNETALKPTVNTRKCVWWVVTSSYAFGRIYITDPERRCGINILKFYFKSVFFNPWSEVPKIGFNFNIFKNINESRL